MGRSAHVVGRGVRIADRVRQSGSVRRRSRVAENPVLAYSQGMKLPPNLLSFPHAIQTYEHDCGAAVLQGVLLYYGVEIRKQQIYKHAKTNKVVGTLIRGMLSTIKRHGLDYDSRSMTLDELKAYLDKKIPVILFMEGGTEGPKDLFKDFGDSHWVVAIGYDETKVYLEDPYSYNRVYLTHAELLKHWHGKELFKEYVRHGIAVVGKKPMYDPDKVIHLDYGSE